MGRWNGKASQLLGLLRVVDKHGGGKKQVSERGLVE